MNGLDIVKTMLQLNYNKNDMIHFISKVDHDMIAKYLSNEELTKYNQLNFVSTPIWLQQMPRKV